MGVHVFDMSTSDSYDSFLNSTTRGTVLLINRISSKMRCWKSLKTSFSLKYVHFTNNSISLKTAEKQLEVHVIFSLMAQNLFNLKKFKLDTPT